MQSIPAAGLWPRFKNRFIGDKAFYQMVLALIIPIVIQNTVSNVVNLLDNVMVGALGTNEMSGVAIANHLVFVFNLATFGALAGAGIYGAQFAGAKNWEGFRQTFRIKLLMSLAISAGAAFALVRWPTALISYYLQGEGSPADAQAMLIFGRQYLSIMLWGLLPFAVTQSYSGALRETGETKLPMVSSLVAVLVNLVFNYVLIYGKLGFPALGVQGAAIATVFSRFVELAIVAFFAHANRDKFPFLPGVYRRFKINGSLAKNVIAKGFPLFANEFLWSLGIVTMTQIFSTRGLTVVAGLNIASSISNLFNVFVFSMGAAVSIVIGQSLGANDLELAKRQVWKLLFFGVSMCVLFGAALALSAEYIARIYNTEAEVRRLATGFMRVSAAVMPLASIANTSYFTIRSGGKTFITLLFDSVYTWVFCVPYTYALVLLTTWRMETLYPVSQATSLVKAVLGLVVVRSGWWAHNLVSSPDKKATSSGQTELA